RLIRALGAVVPPPPPAPYAAPVHAHVVADNVIAGEAARVALAGLPALPQTRSITVTTAVQAAAEQAAIGGPVILKVESDAVAHKSEAGFVSAALEGPTVAPGFAALDAARI